MNKKQQKYSEKEREQYIVKLVMQGLAIDLLKIGAHQSFVVNFTNLSEEEVQKLQKLIKKYSKEEAKPRKESKKETKSFLNLIEEQLGDLSDKERQLLKIF